MGWPVLALLVHTAYWNILKIGLLWIFCFNSVKPTCSHPIGCFILHFYLQINFIIKPSVPLGKLANMCDFRQIPIIFRPPPTAIYPTVPFLADFTRIHVITYLNHFNSWIFFHLSHRNHWENNYRDSSWHFQKIRRPPWRPSLIWPPCWVKILIIWQYRHMIHRFPHFWGSGNHFWWLEIHRMIVEQISGIKICGTPPPPNPGYWFGTAVKARLGKMLGLWYYTYIFKVKPMKQ